ncbi:trypsin-like peptidase domain-containing protein [Streptomyces sp. SID3212]|uniref:S1C family serine protease n=1 Tax=Streptomyces sp. SID3212 TaxID=2690259 RepID=UPI001370451E|nr:trypsin-like peptidase domain-containing protein [Streptomyces sp. SID3212]MYV52687.1 trypsin-like serine protease [Streptomyces sp. SID3212]
MTNYWGRTGGEDSEEHQPQGAFGDPAFPPPPPYQPDVPAHHGHGGHGGHSGTPAARRLRGPVGLLAAVAVAAAVVGGGTAGLVEHFSGDNNTSTTSTTVSGASVSQSSLGTVAGVAKAVSPAIVEINATSDAGEATGSGVVLTSDGEIVTNNHVIADASSVKVQLTDGKSYTARVVGADPAKDLALIKLEGASDLKTATLGDSSQVKVGDEVVAIGSPEGLSGTVTSGIVSALDRDVTVPKETDQSQQRQQQDQGGGWPFQFGGQQFNGDTGDSTTTYKAIQTDASLNPGNSGGALINMEGQIIGINSAIFASGSGTSSAEAGNVGLGFAIPVDTVKADLPSLRDGGSN